MAHPLSMPLYVVLARFYTVCTPNEGCEVVGRYSELVPDEVTEPVIPVFDMTQLVGVFPTESDADQAGRVYARELSLESQPHSGVMITMEVVNAGAVNLWDMTAYEPWVSCLYGLERATPATNFDDAEWDESFCFDEEE